MRTNPILALTGLLVGCSGGYFILNAPLPADTSIVSSTSEVAFMVVGCVPQNRPSTGGVIGSSWELCNDLDFVKDKVVESTRVSCMDMFKAGVVDSFTLVEVNNRTWSQFRFSCRELLSDGTLGSAPQNSPELLGLTGAGTSFTTAIPTSGLSIGVLEVANKLSVRESLLQIGIEHSTADAIRTAGSSAAAVVGIMVSTRIPTARPVLLSTFNWECPSGMVMTGAAIGHIPDADGSRTRPVYLLAECRKLRKN